MFSKGRNLAPGFQKMMLSRQGSGNGLDKPRNLWLKSIDRLSGSVLNWMLAS